MKVMSQKNKEMKKLSSTFLNNYWGKWKKNNKKKMWRKIKIKEMRI